tara:strand:+ start:595 stop:903 length:309 start_codon:yes stop_codon:yes gene_type:complete
MTPEELFRKRGGIRMITNIAPISATSTNPLIYSPAPQYRTAPGLGNAELLNAKTVEPEEEPTKKLGKSESALSRRERLRRRREAAFKYTSIQKQGGKAQSGT